MKWFEMTLVILTLGSGLVLLLEKLFLAKRRAARAGLLDEGKEPVVVDYSRAFFPVLAFILILRSFIAEPFRIPSSSMMPNLLIGDFILVNKFSYGLRLPVTNRKIVPIGEPKRGDLVVFLPPHNPNQNWIKRVIGLPGDRIGFHGDTLAINGKPLKYDIKGQYVGKGPGVDMTGTTLLLEHLPGRPHTVLERLGLADPRTQGDWEVPAGQYLVMGDNRDHSDDGRMWGLLPETHLRGKAFLVMFNCSGWFCNAGFDTSRLGNRIQ